MCATLFAVGFGSGCDSQPPLGHEPLRRGDFRGYNLILITVDTLRADHLGIYGYERNTSPNIDRIASESVVFDRAQAQRGLTWPSLASILTGLYPATTNVRNNGHVLAPDVPTLASTLKASGYKTGAFLANACRGTEWRGFDLKKCFLRDLSLMRSATKWLKQAHDKPLFLWMHLMTPHAAYRPKAEYNVFTQPGYSGPRVRSRETLDSVVHGGKPPSKEIREHLIALYDGEVLSVDAMIGRLSETLIDTELLDRSIIVFTSDHGEELGQHFDYYYHACSIYDAVLHIPLLIRFPDGRFADTRVAELVESIDIAPTLLELLGVAVEGDVEGRSVLGLLNRESDAAERFTRSIAEYYFPGLGEIFSIRTDRWRYIYNPEGLIPTCRPPGDYFRLAREELYDHVNDPMETLNVAAEHPEIVNALREELLNSRPATSSHPARLVDPEMMEQLEALGYLRAKEP